MVWLLLNRWTLIMDRQNTSDDIGAAVDIWVDKSLWHSLGS